MKEHIDLDEYFLDWDEFHQKYPEVERWEYELGVKQTQEM